MEHALPRRTAGIPRTWSLCMTSENHGTVGPAGCTFSHAPDKHERVLVVEVPAAADAPVDQVNLQLVGARRRRPVVEGDAIARSKRILHLVDEYVEQQTAGRRTALRCALMDQFSREITPHQLLEVARATGLRQFLHGVNATDARQLLADFVAAVPAAACGAQQTAAAGAQLVIGVAAPQGATISILQPHADGTTTVIYGGTHPAGDSMGRAVVAAAPGNTPEFGGIKTSALGTPEAPSDQTRLDWLIENDAMVYRGERFLVAQPNRPGIEGWGFGETPRAAIDAAIAHRTAQLDGGQEGSAT